MDEQTMARPARITAEQILDEAAILLAEGGLGAVTLRNLAARLGVQAPSLARHVGDKASLTALLSARIFTDALADIAPGQHGASWLRAFGWALWDKQLATRDMPGLLAAPSHPEAAARIAAKLRAMMADSGLTGQRAHDAQGAVQALVTGWATFARRPGGLPDADAVELRRRFAASLDALIGGFGFA